MYLTRVGGPDLEKPIARVDDDTSERASAPIELRVVIGPRTSLRSR